MSAEGSQAVAGNRKFIYMLLKVGLAITLSVAAYTIAQRRTKSAANRSGDSAENIDKKKRRNVEDEEEIFAYATDGSTQEKEVDEHAVLKHFDWPAGKVDALREAAYEYRDLQNLKSKFASFVDDPQLSCDVALKNMFSLLEVVEQSLYALLHTRDMTIAHYREFSIPNYWLLDSGLVGKIKFASVQLARKCMERVASELDTAGSALEKEPDRELLLLQGVHFAFRVHQFAGGFDSESMQAFEDLRSRAHAHARESSKEDSI